VGKKSSDKLKKLFLGLYIVILFTILIAAFISSGASADGGCALITVTGAGTVIAESPSPTNVYIASLPNLSDVGQQLIFGVSVIATKLNGIPAGTVALMDGNTRIGTSTLDKLSLTVFCK
jgi:hypothetical protein